MPLPVSYGKGRINVAMGSSNKRVEDMRESAIEIEIEDV
jgi:hypothetical protein